MSIEMLLPNRSSRNVPRRIALLTCCTLTLLSTPSWSQAQDGDREVRAAEEQIHSLIKRAEDLRAEGRLDQAENVQREAEQLKERLAGHLARTRGPEGERQRLEKALMGLEQGMDALEILGRGDALEVMRRVLRDVRRELEGGERPDGGPEREERRPDAPRTERDVAIEQLEIMRMALTAVREAGREDTADVLERAIRAREVTLERRADEEAQAIRERAPSREKEIEILAHASRLLRESGHPEKAEIVGNLAERMLASHREGQERDARRQRREDGERGEAAQREGGDREVRERVERAERRVERTEERDEGDRRVIVRREIRRDGEIRRDAGVRRDAPRDDLDALRREVGQLREEIQELRGLLRRLLERERER